MRAYVRTTRHTGISMPFWLAIPIAIGYLVIWLTIAFYTLIAMALLALLRIGLGAWNRRRAAQG